MLTFDDGWRNALNAVPILRALGFKAGILIITGKGIRDVTHPWDLHENLVAWIDGKVPGKGSADVFYELRKSKHTLERELGSKISYLARPCGGYHDAMIKMAKAQGYERC